MTDDNPFLRKDWKDYMMTTSELIQQVPLRPLQSEDELDRAIEMVDRLLDRPELTSDESDYLDALSDIIWTYEEEHDPIP